MYISRVEIDIHNRKKIKELTHLGAYHNWVEQSFPKEVNSKTRTRKLWRIDKIKGVNYLIVLSSKKPDLHLLESYGVENTASTKNYNDYLSSLKEGQKMRFRVVLNPVITLSRGSGQRGVTKPHVTVEYQMKYLLDRSERNGFLLNKDEFTIVERGYETFRKTNQKTIRLIKVIYEGILTVNNINIFRKTLVNGFGKKKAYGFGMMTVIPVVDENGN